MSEHEAACHNRWPYLYYCIHCGIRGTQYPRGFFPHSQLSCATIQGLVKNHEWEVIGESSGGPLLQCKRCMIYAARWGNTLVTDDISCREHAMRVVLRA